MIRETEPMPQQETCGSCKHFDGGQTADIDDRGWCRRNAPAPVHEELQDFHVAWPITNRDRDWCGEHTPRPATGSRYRPGGA
ncbi:hypothetical protein [Candidatus Poriferisodalis sp.]|uniref:hypothetical protein n=1 Tax=Candidatus Poriferisodalis sp. TaxID=3101277 RepID=UPI003B0175AB